MCYAISSDNVTFGNAITIFERMPLNFDSQRIYRPSFVDINGLRRLYYGASATDGRWYTGLTLANVNSPTAFTGIEINDPFFYWCTWTYDNK